ncbi:MAG: molybdopterin converting factor subunit 1 [Gemmatimonadetes bacterium]|nr:molybdopterin converting factor subunit 1 [Gemmatimonadota bacterium]|tara:strand:+ start:3605 stop:3850 length:246 start_codon:yes stop_codon:yes gene_type:complete
MTLRVLLFAQCSDIVGSRKVDLDLPDGSTVQDLMDHFSAKYPPMKKLDRSIMLSVNQEYVEREQLLKDGDEVAVITPVSGG